MVEPMPPEDVHVIYADGRDVAVQTVYAGLSTDGAHRWEIVDAPDGQPVAMKIGILPPNTSVVFR